jgi:hypothetical protein
MHLARQKVWIRVGLLSIVIAALAAVIGCTLVNDSLTGVKLDRATPSLCINSCVKDSDGQLKAEIDRHQAAIAACQASPPQERGACMRAEAAQHQAAMDRIAQGRHDCMNNCHRQGGGSAG